MRYQANDSNELRLTKRIRIFVAANADTKDTAAPSPRASGSTA